MKLAVEMKSYKALELVTSAPQESESRAVAASTKKSLTVDLAGAVTVETSIDVDLLRLNKNDREFVFDLIDKVRPTRMTKSARKIATWNPTTIELTAGTRR